LGSLVASKDVRLMAKSGDLEPKHGVAAKAQANTFKQDLVHAANAIGITVKGHDFCPGQKL
jgi:hypothetical protein